MGKCSGRIYLRGWIYRKDLPKCKGRICVRGRIYLGGLIFLSRRIFPFRADITLVGGFTSEKWIYPRGRINLRVRSYLRGRGGKCRHAETATQQGRQRCHACHARRPRRPPGGQESGQRGTRGGAADKCWFSGCTHSSTVNKNK